MWDTAGQEKYKSIAPIYYRGTSLLISDSQVALCVYDISNKNSFEVMKNWVQELKTQGPRDLLLAIVGNKTDLIDNEKVPYEEAKNFARDSGAVFKLVSAKEGKGINVNVKAFRNFSPLSPSNLTCWPTRSPRTQIPLWEEV